MTDLQVTFLYNSAMTVMQCKKDEYVRELLNKYVIKIDKKINELRYFFYIKVLF